MMTLKQKIRKALRIMIGLENYFQNEEIKYFLNQNYKSPIDSFIQDSYKFFGDSGLYHLNYRSWRTVRIRKILKIFGTDWFKGKRILELGSGLGEIGAFFAELGADVLCVEGRRENVDFANLKYRNLKGFKCVQMDLDEDFSKLGKFDLVICFGLIEVMKDINYFVMNVTKISNSILLDTLICDNSFLNYRIRICPIRSSFTISDDSNLNGGGVVKYTAQFIESCFCKYGFTFKRFDDGDLNTKTHKYDWKEGEIKKKEFINNSYRRFWLFER